MLVMNECVCDELMIVMWLSMCMMCVMLELSKGREENIEIRGVSRTQPLSGFIQALSGLPKFLLTAQRLYKSAQPESGRKQRGFQVSFAQRFMEVAQRFACQPLSG